MEENGELSQIIVKGAREHNLKDVDVKVPREKFVVITGVSGSGKSSLAFDTLYAEGQRRYVECLSAYARQYLGMMKKPELDSVEGLSPSISIEQKTISRNPRSTVGTATEIYDYIRLLYARVGTQYCVECRIPVEKKSQDQIVEEVLELYENKRIMILSPLVKARKGHYRELFERLQRQGFTKARIDGEIKNLTPGMSLSRYQTHYIELVVDRTVASKEQESRISESIQLALKMGDETIMIMYETGDKKWEEKLFSSKYSCPSCGKAYRELAPNMFSYNSPYGACPECDGMGEITEFDLRLVIPDDNVSIRKGGVAPLGKERPTWFWNQALAFAEKENIDLDAPIKDIPEQKLNRLLYGGGEQDATIEYQPLGAGRTAYKHKFIGVLNSLKYHYDHTGSSAVQKKYEKYMSPVKCEGCGGGRLKIENLNVFIADKSIQDAVELDITQSKRFFKSLNKKLNKQQKKIAENVVKEIVSRLSFMEQVGLSYLTLNRSARTLSGGESQRIKLAAQIGSELTGILYVLDEPSIGLHQRDNDKLISSLKNLRDLGNSVIVVEHDKAMIEKSDYIIDIGPGAGVNGGEIILSNTPDKIKKLSDAKINGSLTAKYLKSKKEIEVPAVRRKGNGKILKLLGAEGNNLKNVDLEMPLGVLICVTGMSGSGKSTLLNETLYPALARKLYNSTAAPLPYKSLEGLENIKKAIEINQAPIGRTPRSNPATYTGVFTLIREFFAKLPESQVRGYKPGRFSFNVKGGRCEECEGAGLKKYEMNFLPDVYVRCGVCDGKRYNNETLQVKYKGKSIADVLDLTVVEALDFFSEIPKIKRKMKVLNDVGLGYITLGQQAPTLSGGEAQRVKLSKELSKLGIGKTLYLLDEPTTGLHFEDVRILLKLLNKLVDKGNTVVIIEHNLEVIKCADWIIDLGPEGGSKGGEIIAQGTPEQTTKNPQSYTGEYLKKELN